MTIKVWNISLGRDCIVVAATSKKAAVAAIGRGWTVYSFSNYASETANEADVEQAMSDVGVAFARPLDQLSPYTWERLNPS